MVTASHNPPDYNGMKFVREGSRPISGDNGLQDIRRLAEPGVFTTPTRVGERFAVDIMPEYIEHLLSYVDRSKLKPLKVVVHAGNGGAGLIIDKLEPYLPFKFIKVHHEPDGTFPNGVPNPMLIENHARARRGAAQARRRLRDLLGRRLRPLLPVRREGRLHRGLLHRRPAGRRVPASATRAAASSTTRA